MGYPEKDWWTGKPIELIVAQRRLVDNYKTYRLFARATPRFPRGMDRGYGLRHLTEARFWMRRAKELRAA